MERVIKRDTTVIGYYKELTIVIDDYGDHYYIEAEPGILARGTFIDPDELTSIKSLALEEQKEIFKELNIKEAVDG
ncbi:MAG: hypothetical protein ACRCUS_00490 [Anaerovoracaceae bacterium]